MNTPASPIQLNSGVQRRSTPSATLYINERVNQMWAEGREVYHLGFGESRFPVHPKIAAALQANVDHKSYVAAQGIQALRSQVAQFYRTYWRLNPTPEQVIIAPGSKALLYALLQALDGDLLLPTPSWVSYAAQADLLGKPVHWLPASPIEGYALTVDALDATVRHVRGAGRRPGVLILNSPNNPTGAMLSPSLLADLADYCRAQGIVVVSDELYGLVTHGRTPHQSIAEYYPEGSVVMGGLSKQLSLGGWRLGLAIVPPGEAGRSLMHALVTIASEVWSTASAPVQYAALTAYSGDPEIMDYICECSDLHALRTQYLWRALTDLGLRCPQPSGGFYLFPNFDQWQAPLAARGIATSDDLARTLLDEYGLATLPGSAFGVRSNELSLRLAASYLDMETDEKAAALLAAFRASSDPDDLMQRHTAMHEAIARLGHFIENLSPEPER